MEEGWRRRGVRYVVVRYTVPLSHSFTVTTVCQLGEAHLFLQTPRTAHSARCHSPSPPSQSRGRESLAPQ